MHFLFHCLTPTRETNDQRKQVRDRTIIESALNYTTGNGKIKIRGGLRRISQQTSTWTGEVVERTLQRNNRNLGGIRRTQRDSEKIRDQEELGGCEKIREEPGGCKRTMKFENSEKIREPPARPGSVRAPRKNREPQ
uniref:Uncharacterized protein n=1 Tax=Fagus sylvatica TaxID=28930 RepID=A0A2N9G1S0_FAGSY